MMVRLLALFTVISHVCGFSQITVKTDRADAFYQVTDSVYFIVNTPFSDSVQYFIQRDGRTPKICLGTIWAEAGIDKGIAYKGHHSDVVVCTVKSESGTATAAAAIGAWDIQPFEPDPADFDTWWGQQVTQLAQIPMDIKINVIDSSEYSNTYQINLATVSNRRVYGYISIPKGKGPFPAILTLPAFGDLANIVQPETEVAEIGGAISMTISIHNAPPNQQDPKAYLPNDFTTRDSNYYRLSVLAGIRAIDYLFSRPDFDGQSLGLTGVSQGGGIAALISGIDRRVNAISESGAPMGEHTGNRYSFASAFPFYYFVDKDLGVLTSESVLGATKYFDAIRSMKRFKGAALLFTGYKDDLAPPAIAYGLFNMLGGGPKIILQGSNFGHEHPDEYWQGRFNFWRRFFPAMRSPPKPYVSKDLGYWTSAGSDTILPVGVRSMQLKGVADINGNISLPLPVYWRKVCGPGSVVFTNPNSRETTVTFGLPGEYTLTFYADDNASLTTLQRRTTFANSVHITIQ